MTKKPTKRKTTTARRKGKRSKAARTPAAPRRSKPRDPRLPQPGKVLARTYKGKEYRVTVLDTGFRFDGKEWRSLTAIARAVTGYPAISGPAWFGIAERAPVAPKRGTKRDAADKPVAAPDSATT